MFSYDLYNLVGGPGLWHQPEPIINNPIPEFDPYEEFLWPVLRIGPSPEAGKRRIHIYANNDPPVGNAEYNIIYGYADVEYDEATFTMDVSPWNWRTFPMLDHWQDEQIKRAIKDMAVSREDGQVALIGHAADSLWIYYSSDYGVNFAYKSQNAHYPVYNPWNIDPITLEPSEPFFLNNDGSEAELFLETNGDGGHYNVIFTDNNTKIVFMSAMGLNTVESAANNQYYPAHFHPKIFVYNVLTEEFDFIDLQITGVDPYDNQPMIPFDLDEDGIVDNHDENGNVEFVDCWPTYYFNGDSQTGSFHESLFKIASNEEMGWCVALFQDGRNLQNAYYEVPGYEEWSEVAEIAITASTDHGIHWSAPSYMNALASDVNYYPELANMLPAYVYINDEIEYVAENLGRLHLFFLDDNSYGSFATSNAGQNNGGTMMYATLLIDFSPANDTDDNTVIASSGLSQNYPNPFNPSTTIPYYMREQGEVKLEVYNIKGQFIRTLVSGYRDAGVHSVIWDGTDEKDRAVPSGIYFYRMRTKQETETKKMILMK
ncbi:MAG: T9SS type A sorting domain-containing protein, partial [Candidatus Cloacimonetes bacterium]|nr:T9SS type A sorting domain-containing protein [Candidatus Cloacimonadota bacterium]